MPRVIAVPALRQVSSCLSLPSFSEGKRLCFPARVPLYICTPLIKYFHCAPFPSGNRCLMAKLLCLTRAATDYTCWLQTQALFFSSPSPPSPLLFIPFWRTTDLKKLKNLCTAFTLCPQEQPPVAVQLVWLEGFCLPELNLSLDAGSVRLSTSGLGLELDAQMR